MPATAQSLIVQAVGLGYDALSERDLKEATLAVAAPGGGGLTLADAQSLIDLAFANGEDALSERDIMLCLAGFYGNLATQTAQQAVVTAAANKYAALSDLQLTQALLVILSQGGSGLVSTIIVQDGLGGFWQIVVDPLGNVGAEVDPGPVTADVILSDGMGGFWKVIVNSSGLRGLVTNAGPATTATRIPDGIGDYWTLIADSLGNLGAIQVP